VEAAPLILTLALDAAAQARFEALRAQHFPPGRNQVPAHITLFHALPGAEQAAVAAELARSCADTAPFAIQVAGLRSLGRGVAYVLQSAGLMRVRAGLARAWAPWLSAQDRQGYRPHLTVQNKADPASARALLASLQAGFSPFEVEATGLLLWHYRGGPWEEAGRFAFVGLAKTASVRHGCAPTAGE
jgi:2'-5' RNA ligase